jgi:hypothetical protein
MLADSKILSNKLNWKQSHRNYCYSLVNSLELQALSMRDNVGMYDIKFFLELVDDGIKNGIPPERIAARLREFVEERANAK